jgi:SAM-dependent methyltransferase
METTITDIKPGFSHLYAACRMLEGRMYDDQIVVSLPEIPGIHPHATEWRERKRSLEKIRTWLINQKRPLHILDAGCGNGWMAASLAKLPGITVTAADITGEEIDQCRRVFGQLEGLEIVEGDICNLSFPPGTFDMILFAASIQYFADLDMLFTLCSTWLTKNGTILLSDSFIYNEDEVQNARQRSYDYYHGLGMDGMTARYHHHNWKSLNRFRLEMIYDPSKPFNRLRKLGIFPLILLKPC